MINIRENVQLIYLMPVTRDDCCFNRCTETRDRYRNIVHFLCLRPNRYHEHPIVEYPRHPRIECMIFPAYKPSSIAPSSSKLNGGVLIPYR